MQSYSVTLVGKTDLLHHHDNIEFADAMDQWKVDPANKKGSKAGDDRSPAYRWIGSLYHDGRVVALPQDNLMRCLLEGGALVLVPGGKNGKTFKAQTQSGLLSGDAYWPITVGTPAKEIAVAPLLALQTEPDFKVHQTVVRRHGFDLFLKRARIGSSKHVRVRPLFRDWQARGTLHVIDDQITKGVLEDILTCAGTYKGLGDWRPSSRTPGAFGCFSARVEAAAS